MRAATIGLVTIPVLVAGSLGIAAAVGVIGAPSADSTGPAGTTTAASPSPSMTEPGHGGGTAIDGAKPHLTVVDGRATFTLPGALPAILSVLPYRPVDLQPLPSSIESPSSPANRTADKALTPGTRAFEVPRLQNPTMPPATGGYVSSLPPTQATVGGTPATSQIGGPQIDPRSAPGSPPVAQASPDIDPVRNAPDVGVPGRPPHASDNGRPPHADQTGRPPHASDNGRPDHAGQTGRPDHADQNGRPDHAGQTGRPPHASDNGRGNSGKSDDGRGNGADNTQPSPR